MKPHKDDESTPAGVPHLQEVGYTVEGTNADVQSFIETHNRIFDPEISSEKGE